MARVVADPRQTKFVLDESRIPRSWYNIAADLPEPPPPVLHPGTGQPIGPGDLAPLFPMELIKQVVSTDREIEIPEPVRDAYRLYRPSPLYRAHRLERALDTPAHIYYKYEGGSPSGSHKPNTALAQAFYNKEEGVTRLATETGAGQWGSALAFAGAVFGLEVKVYMVRASYDQKPYRRIADGNLRVRGRGQSEPGHQVRQLRAGRRAGPYGFARDRDQRGHRGHRDPSGHEVLARVGVRLRPASPDRHRPGIDRADGHGRRGAGRDHRLRRWRLQLRRADLPVAGPNFRDGARVPDHRRRARGGAVAYARRLRLRLRRHREDDAVRQDAYARFRTSSPSRSTPAASATTGCRPSCRC